MKAKLALDIRIDARDRRLCLTTCPHYSMQVGAILYYHLCSAFDEHLKCTKEDDQPLRCSQCLRREVK